MFIEVQQIDEDGKTLGATVISVEHIARIAAREIDGRTVAEFHFAGNGAVVLSSTPYDEVKRFLRLE